MTDRLDPPYAVTAILDGTVESILGGSSGWFHVPPGGNLRCDWLSRKGCYRLTIDLTAGHAFDDAAADYCLETRRRLERILPLTAPPIEEVRP